MYNLRGEEKGAKSEEGREKVREFEIFTDTIIQLFNSLRQVHVNQAIIVNIIFK